MRPIYTAFFTKGTLYEHEASRLRTTLIQHGLEHDIRAIESRGDWRANSGYTATHILNVIRDHPCRPVVQLDADAVVWKYPWLFDELQQRGIDIAVHYRRGYEMLNGTVWISPTEPARQVIQRYEELVLSANGGCANEQKMLQVAIEEMSNIIKLEKLPAGYCWIHDVMKDDLTEGEEPTIEHLQASRESNAPGTEYHANRRRRIAEIEGASPIGGAKVA